MEIEIILDKNLTKRHTVLMNRWRKKEFGPQWTIRNFKKDYLPGARFFFLKENRKIVAFGTLRKVTINYLGKKYNILGICNIISIEKGKGYGKILIAAMIKYLKKTGKTGLGFCRSKNTQFYKKAGLNTIKDLTKRFALRNATTNKYKYDEEGGDGIYIDGKDKLIKKVLSTKGTGTYYLPDIKQPHW